MFPGLPKIVPIQQSLPMFTYNYLFMKCFSATSSSLFGINNLARAFLSQNDAAAVFNAYCWHWKHEKYKCRRRDFCLSPFGQVTTRCQEAVTSAFSGDGLIHSRCSASDCWFKCCHVQLVSVVITDSQTLSVPGTVLPQCWLQIADLPRHSHTSLIPEWPEGREPGEKHTTPWYMYTVYHGTLQLLLLL